MEFDTDTLAILFMNSGFTSSLVRTQEDMDHTMVYNSTSMFMSLQQHLLNSVEIIKQAPLE